MLIMLVAAEKILAFKVGTSIDWASLPCQPTALCWCLLLALLVYIDFFVN
jgi:hypothetical protein